MSGGTRYLICTDAEQVEAATVIAGQSYEVISLESAKNGHLAEISGKPIVIWPDKETVGTARAWGRELAVFGEVKLLDVSKGFCPTPQEMVAQEWDFKQMLEWISGKAEHSVNIIELVKANGEYSEVIEQEDKLRITNSASPDDNLPSVEVDPATDDSPDAYGSPADAPDGLGEAEPPWLREGPPDDDTVPPVDYHPGLAGRAYDPPETRSEAAEWADPLDFWGTEGLPQLVPDMMPPAFAHYALDAANRAGVDAPQVALNCWIACASLLRRGITLNMQQEAREGRTWREKPILWGAVIGLASTGKGPGMDIAFDHFKEIASDLRRKDEQAWKDYEHKAKTYEIAMQAYYREAAKNPHIPMPETPEKPPRERLWTDDATKEVVAKLLTENPRGKITLIKDELSAWFGGFDAYGNGKSDKDRPDWLSFYESKERYIDRVGPGASYHVESWGGCIVGGIQPDVLAKVAAKLGPDGMLQRFMLIVNRPKIRPPKREPDYTLIRGWNTLLDNLARMEPRGNPIVLSDDAAAFMDECGEWITNATQAGLSPGLDAAIGKWEGLFGRLAITAHCIGDAARGSQHPSPVVGLETVQQCWRWMKNMLWPHLLHYYGGTMEASSMDKSVRAFADFVLARDITEIKPHALASHWTHYRREIKTIQQRREFWDAVCLTGWAKASGGMDRTGSISSQYAIHPRVHVIFKQRKAIAKVQAQRYREIAHPGFIGAQTREPGED